jgi:predicted TPR repeat methyltransferase
MTSDWHGRAHELSSEAIAHGEPTAWFDRLYACAEAGDVSMPWERDEPHILVREWVEAHDVRGAGRRAVVVGSGLGADAEYVASCGFETTGFDISPSAVRLARARHPGTSVDYRVADLLALPDDWRHAFDLVVEVFTVQALPDPPRSEAARGIAGLVAPGGTLLAVEFRHTDGHDVEDGPPFSLTAEVMNSLAVDGLEQVTVEELEGPRWRVAYRRAGRPHASTVLG